MWMCGYTVLSYPRVSNEITVCQSRHYNVCKSLQAVPWFVRFPALLSTHRNVYLLYRLVIQSPCTKYNPQRLGNFNLSLLFLSLFLFLIASCIFSHCKLMEHFTSFLLSKLGVINKRKARFRKPYGDILVHIF